MIAHGRVVKQLGITQHILSGDAAFWSADRAPAGFSRSKS